MVEDFLGAQRYIGVPALARPALLRGTRSAAAGGVHHSVPNVSGHYGRQRSPDMPVRRAFTNSASGRCRDQLRRFDRLCQVRLVAGAQRAGSILGSRERGQRHGRNAAPLATSIFRICSINWYPCISGRPISLIRMSGRACATAPGLLGRTPRSQRPLRGLRADSSRIRPRFVFHDEDPDIRQRDILDAGIPCGRQRVRAELSGAPPLGVRS